MHFSLQKAVINAALELVERDAYVRWWMKPEQFSIIKPLPHEQEYIAVITRFLGALGGNDLLDVRLMVLNSPILSLRRRAASPIVLLI